MSYVDQNLMAGERVVWRTRCHWIMLLGPLVLAVLFLLVGLAMLVSADTRPAAIVSILVALLAGLLLLARFVTYRTSEFAVTSKRVIIKVGLLRRRSVEILLSKVEVIGVDQPLLGRMTGYGSITVGGTGGTKEVFHQIQSPLEFRRKVQEQTAQ